jgi:phytoene dehydrogenase-like protein
VELVHPGAPLAHPFDDGSAAVLERSLGDTAAGLGPDRRAYERLMGLFVRSADDVLEGALAPPLPPHHPLLLARLGLVGLRPAQGLARARFEGKRARGLFAGLAAHSMLSLRAPGSAAFGIMLAAVGHAYGWPLVHGGSQKLADGLVSYLRSLGGEVETGRMVESVDELPPAATVLLDLAPRGIARVARSRLPQRYLRALGRFRYGPGVFKVDWALDGPVPWRAAECSRAATVHLGGTLEEITAAQESVARGEIPERPFVLVAQQSLFDPTRAPREKHTLWTYCHVPNGSAVDVTDRIESQIERFAPGFRELVLARNAMSAGDFERYNPNYVGGDINGGLQDLRQLFARPVARLVPYATPAAGLFVCSSSTPPGGGVHGMCGYLAAGAALRRLRA